MIAAQVYLFDTSASAGSSISFIETMSDVDFYQLAQIVQYNFGLPF